MAPALCLADGDRSEAPAPTSEDLKAALNPKNLTYCAYQCGDHCELLLGTRNNDSELKKKVYDERGYKEQYGIDFDPKVIFCHGCKNEDAPHSIVLTECTVRACAIERGLACCTQCAKLAECELALWKKFPEHKEYVLKLQAKYVELYEFKLI